MAASIPFLRAHDPAYGKAVTASPLIRRLTANNPGPFTYLGTGVYIVGRGEVAVIDPGPDDAEHLNALMKALEGERVTHILVTHGHADHCPAARPLAEKTGAVIYANAQPTKSARLDVQMEADHDGAFHPDVHIDDGDVLSGPGWTLEAVATPGHTSNHTCFVLREENALFSGDHIMGWSTTVVTPPDGDMDAYLQSLDKIRARNFQTIWPTHGPPITEVAPFLDAYKAHRLAREAQIMTQIRAGRSEIAGMVEAMYADVDKRLHPAARHSVFAHIIRMTRQGVLTTEGEPRIDGYYRLRAG